MPRSHSVAVAALTTSIVFIVCVESPSFAVSLIFSSIVMFDSSGVRRQSVEHAILLNQLIKDVQYFADEIKDWKHKEKIEKHVENKEMLGHQPIEVVFGGLLGVVVAILLHFL